MESGCTEIIVQEAEAFEVVCTYWQGLADEAEDFTSTTASHAGFPDPTPRSIRAIRPDVVLDPGTLRSHWGQSRYLSLVRRTACTIAVGRGLAL